MAARIGFDVTAALAQGGGIGRYTRELIHALVAQDTQNTYRLFSAKPPAQPPVPDSLPTTPNVTHKPAPVAEHWLYRIWYRFRLPIPVQTVTGSIDLFHSPDFVLPPVSGNIPTLLTVHDLSFVFFPDTFPSRLVDYLNKVVPWSVNRASHVLADSVATQNDLQNVWGIPEDKITVLTSGVNERFQPVTDQHSLNSMRDRYGLGETPFFLSVGTVQPRKNYQMLVRAFRPVADQVPHNLVIAGGRGWLVDPLLEEIERQELQERVRLIGFVDDADLPALYSAATALVFPSLYEGFGLPLLEAMACGTPVISSDASCLPEVVMDSARNVPAGILIDPADEAGWTSAMIEMAKDEGLGTELAVRGKERAAQYRWESTARNLLTVYQRLLAES
ncbi:MAG: glycosyltransferase family 1 protein [Chloroflexota bacterium]